MTTSDSPAAFDEGPDEPERTPRAKKPRRGGVLGFLRDVAVVVGAAIVISFLIKTFLIRSFYIPSESMETTLMVNDRIIVNLLEPAVIPISRGDVVVFRDPGDWLGGASTGSESSGNPLVEGVDWVLQQIGLQADDANDHLIKRVIGLPGDRIQCCSADGRLLVNGVPIDEPYVHHDDPDAPASDLEFDVTVPEGTLWVMGDNREHSADSRAHIDDPGRGFVPISTVVGRAIIITWPIDRWTWLDNHGDTFADVPEPETASAG